MNNDKDRQDTSNQCIVEEKISKATGETQIRKYSKGRLLGKGGFAKCYEFRNLETQQITAAKVIAKSSLVKSRAKQKLISEIKIHKALHHQNIVGFEHYFEDSENVYLLLEICNNQSLNELLKRRKNLTELEVLCYTAQIIRALKYLHSHRIIHRDLKLGNLFISDKMEIKVGDFGLATKLEFDGERKRTVCGTPNYIAPEILDGKTGHSYEVDIWSLGVIIYTLIIGKPPFETNNVKETYKRIKMNSYTFPERALISEPAKELIKEILVLDPSKRPSLDDITKSDFFNMGTSIPKLLQPSTLACPPSISYMKQFIPDIGSNGIVNKPVVRKDKSAEGGPADRAKLQSQPANQANNFGNTHNMPSSMLPEGSARPYTTSGMFNYTSDTKSGAVVGSDIWVKKWIDYSSKYGMGYVLSNGHVGIYFNDSTKIIYKPMGLNFIYVERKPSEKVEIITTHLLSEDFQKDLQKKVILLQHFKQYLLDESRNEQQEKKESDNIDDKNFVYVKKWMRTKHAILFRLSNKIVQVCFLDQTEIILSSETKLVTYVNKKGERRPYPLSSALDSNNTEMTKRLRYTKEILTHMLNSRTQGTGDKDKHNA
ncbi:MAG: CDC5/polo family serine/threonine-protein kinase [archaeon]|nr:CDC5/polo family serine/threonine-protein kinase [archaeon]